MTARKMKQYKTRRRGENRAGQSSRGRREFRIQEEEEEEEEEPEPILYRREKSGESSVHADPIRRGPKARLV